MAPKAEPATDNATMPDQDAVSWAQKALRERELRRHFLPREMIREPAWDILLDLFVADAQGRQINTTSACIASGVPTATALRWIDALQEAGLLRRTHDPVDRRVTLVALTDEGRDRLTAYIRSLERTA